MVDVGAERSRLFLYSSGPESVKFKFFFLSDPPALDQQISATVPLEMANHDGYSTQAASRQWQGHKGVQSSMADWQTLDAARGGNLKVQ